MAGTDLEVTHAGGPPPRVREGLPSSAAVVASGAAVSGPPTTLDAAPDAAPDAPAPVALAEPEASAAELPDAAEHALTLPPAVVPVPEPLVPVDPEDAATKGLGLVPPWAEESKERVPLLSCCDIDADCESCLMPLPDLYAYIQLVELDLRFMEPPDQVAQLDTLIYVS
jgi:hypothetical protein